MNRIAIITGITGQDGSYMADLLIGKGYKVYGLKRRTSKNGMGCSAHLQDNPDMEVVEGDLADLSSLSRLCKMARAHEFYNLAAQSHVGTSFDQPIYTLEATGAGVINCLEAIRGSGYHTRFYQACHDEETVAVTPNGLRSYDQLSVGDRVFTLNEQTGRTEIKTIKRVMVFDGPGEMVQIKGRRLDQMLTPNHQVILRDDRGEIVRVSAEHLPSLMPYERISHLSMPTGLMGARTNKSVRLADLVDVESNSHNHSSNLIEEMPLSDLLYLLGLYAGDGYFATAKKAAVKYRHGSIGRGESGRFEARACDTVDVEYPSSYIIFAVPRGDKARKPLEDTLDRLGIRYRGKSGTVEFASLPLSRVFRLAGSGVYDKKVPDFVWECEPSDASHFLRGLVDSDGCIRRCRTGSRESVTTTSEMLAVGAMAMAAMTGRHASYCVREDAPAWLARDSRFIYSRRPAYVVGIANKACNKVYRHNIQTVKYSGKVWCLEVDGNHNFMVARNGKVAISGNSTSELFGGSDQSLNESSVFHPRSPYASAKLYGYWVTVNYRESYRMHASNGILFNHESARRGANFVTRKITLGIAEIVAGRANKIKLGNIDARRDWGHARDYVDGMWAMLQQRDPGDYVLATGETHSVREFCHLAFQHAGLGDYQQYIEIDPTLYRPNEVHTLIGDASKANRELGWYSTTTFQHLVEEMVNADLAGVEKHIA